MIYWILKIVQILLILPLGWLSLNLRTPLLANLRTELLWIIPIGCLAVFLPDGLSYVGRRHFAEVLSKEKRFSRFLILVLCSVGLAIFLTTEIEFRLTKYMLLTREPSQIEVLGQHIIVGYRDIEDVTTLVEKRGIGGIFITARNIQGKSIEDIRQEITRLQAIRAEQELPPLWIATDQEGGVVSRLSPPLTQLPPLADWVRSAQTPAERQHAAIRYGDIQGQELADVGINLNFAPVVDLNKGIVNPKDRFSVIYQRAISDDKTVVAQAAQDYCDALESRAVRCTLKHFPGLGRLTTDTHVSSATLDTPMTELMNDDWYPFQQIMGQSQAFTMLGHPILTDVDAQHPVSFSEDVVGGIVRQQWHHDGVLITDDVSMRAFFYSRDGFEEAVVKSLNAGVDLILIAYDPDLYYPAMAALIQAIRGDRIPQNVLSKSQHRLQQNLESLYQHINQPERHISWKSETSSYSSS